MKFVLDEEYIASIPSTIFNVQRRKLVLKNGNMFLLTTESGDIEPPSSIDLGLFYKDTRYLSHYCLCIGGIKPLLLSSSSERNFFSQIEMTFPKIIRGEEKKRRELPKNSVHIRRSQILSNETFFDFIDINNYSTYEFTFPLRLQFFFDFFDMFEVRGLVRRIKKGKYLKSIIEDKSESDYEYSRVLSSYIGMDGLTRRANIIFSSKPDQLEETSAKWYVTLKPRKTFSLRVCIKLDTDVCDFEQLRKDKMEILREENADYDNWIYSLTKIKTSNETLQDTINRGIFDLKSLTSMEKGLRIIHAGIPWFSVPFGRDSIITSLQTLMLSPEIAKENLLYLASMQGKEVNEFNEEEPGKILHEYRYGELANGREFPHIPYYGSIDATPLYLILLSEYYKWTNDKNLLNELLPSAKKALDWIDKYGDLDLDGFVEYNGTKYKEKKGLLHQGWKDSYYGILHKDGSQPVQPIALCEVQGYVYDAKKQWSEIFHSLGDKKTAAILEEDAFDLQKKFNEKFWMKNKDYYAIALDGNKNKVETISSNPGHCLWSGIIPKDKVDKVVRRLLSKDMFSGWGIRTISDKEQIFNPLSYHNGTVWPHDNSIIAVGLKRYGFKEEVIKIFRGLFHASTYFEYHRPPEVLCGYSREDFSAPIQYPVSCSPQAWSSGSLFFIIQAMLGIEPEMPKKTLRIVEPILPKWLESLTLKEMKLGRSKITLDFSTYKERTFCRILDIEGEKPRINIVFF